jgi:hypothetical protein
MNGQAIVDLFTGIVETAESNLVRRLCSVELGLCNHALLKQRLLAITVGLCFVRQHACLSDRIGLFWVDTIIRTCGRQSQAGSCLGQRCISLLHAQLIVLWIDLGNELSPLHYSAEINCDTPQAPWNLDTDRRLIVCRQ